MNPRYSRNLRRRCSGGRAGISPNTQDQSEPSAVADGYVVKAPLSLATRYRERFQQPAVADGYVAKVQPSQTTHEQSEPSAVADGSTVKIPFSLATRYRERF